MNPIEHTYTALNPLIPFVLALMGISILLTFIQAFQTESLLKQSMDRLPERGPKNKTPLERARFFAASLTDTSFRDSFSDEDRKNIEVLRLRLMRYERTQKKITLLTFGVVCLLAGLLMPLRQTIDPMGDLRAQGLPLGFLALCLVAMTYLKLRRGLKTKAV